MSELWDLYDADRKPLGRTHKRGTPLQPGEYHIVVDIWTLNNNGEILVTRRRLDIPYGGFWEGTGGSVVAGEDSLPGARRELLEETGLSALENELVRIFSISVGERHIDTYLFEGDYTLADLRLQKEEVMDAKFVTMAEFERMITEKLIAPPVVERWMNYRGIVLKKVEEIINRKKHESWN